MPGGPKILVVEDEFLVRDMIGYELELAGFDVLQAESAEEALAIALPAARLDLLFTDIRLPGMNGWRLAEEIRARFAAIPVIYASGYAGEVHPLPHSTFMQKPYLPSQLLQAAAELGIKPPVVSAS